LNAKGNKSRTTNSVARVIPVIFKVFFKFMGKG
jgi:hypothetical protein